MALRATATRRPTLDAHRFDSLTRTLSTAGTRRALSGLLATLLGVLALTRPGSALEAEAKKKRRKKAEVEGPCGDGGGKANRCRKHRQCCTGYCNQRKKKRKNGKRRKVAGRCRCRKDGQSCADDINCCPKQTGRSCIEGTCRPSCLDVCSDGCCAGETCEPGTGDAACGVGGGACQTCAGPTPACVAGACICGHVCAEGCRFSSIQDAIDAADPGDTIWLCAETYPGTITIDKDLTLHGAGQGEDGSVLDGQQQGSVITVTEGVTASLTGLHITGGNADNFFLGGGFYTKGGNVTLTDCTVTGNTAGWSGGGVQADGGAVTLINCTITDNTAVDFGGGGIHTHFGPGAQTLELIDCLVSNNSVSPEGRFGGGIFAGSRTTVTLTGTTVTGNSAPESGGGGIMTDPYGTINLTGGSSVFGNTPNNCDAPTTGTFNGPGCAPNP